LRFLRDKAGVRTLSAIVRRDFAVRHSYRYALGLDVVFGLLNLAVYFFISQTFGDQTTHSIGGAPNYFDFVLVGITLTLVVQAATTEMVRALRQEQLTGTLEALVIQPVRHREISLGFAALPMAYAMLRAAVYLTILVFWLDVNVSSASWAGFGGILVVTGLAMLSFGIAGCALVLVFKHGELLVASMILMLGLLGGALFPVAVLPNQLQFVTRLVPTRYAFDGARAAVFGGSGLGTDLMALAVFAAVTLPFSLIFFRRAMIAVRRVGTLSQY
jgi:ABC-2 type transport system permease protein